ncbi:MAG TPA: phosphoribosylformylglycinamidine synthase subunit PurS [Gemmatimonadales bacterium]|nr:phosphoribosylformylglycinamidine synthase subunit PurS [Gemmatimonadales bacterium]
MNWRVHVRVLPRAGLLDPQGQAVQHALEALRFPDASNVHVGKAIALDVSAETEEAARARARQMCDRLLANPVTEDYEIEVEPAGERR